MTTTPGEPVDLPGPEEVQVRVSGRDYPDQRTGEQRDQDAAAAAEQSVAITDEGERPHVEADRMLDAWPRPGAGTSPEVSAVTFGVFEDHPTLGYRVLVVPGQLNLRVPADGAEAARQRALVQGRRFQPPLQQPDEEDCPALRRFDQLTLLFTSQQPVEELRDNINALRAEGLSVAPNYVVPLGHVIKGDDYPRPTAGRRAYTPEWVRREGCGPQVQVAIIDTGIDLTQRGDGWLTGVQRTADNLDLLNVLPKDARLDIGAGHGSFVSGVIEQVAPTAHILMYRGTDTTGMGEEAAIARLMVKAACDGADIIHLSLGTSTATDLPPVAMESAVELIEEFFPRVLIVASAGNMGKERPMWPAAFKQVIAVGALDDAMRPAPFSSHGFWVNCSTVGVGVFSPFPEGLEPSDLAKHPVEFGPDAWGVWTGTSFSAPQISGIVARLVHLYPGLSPRQALIRILDGTQVWPGYGHLIRLLPGS